MLSGKIIYKYATQGNTIRFERSKRYKSMHSVLCYITFSFSSSALAKKKGKSFKTRGERIYKYQVYAYLHTLEATQKKLY